MSFPNEYVHVSPMNEKFTISTEHRCTWRENLGKNVSSPHSKHDWKKPEVKVFPDVLSAFGNTPLIKLDKIPRQAGLKCNIYAKCEFLSPGGSVKDRVVRRIFEDSERQGILKPGMTVIEASSGNTGIALALVSAVKGYKCVIVMSEKTSQEKEAVIRSLGARVVRVSVELPSHPDGPHATACRLRQEIPNSIILDQLSNPGNPLTHYDVTAEEILYQLDNKVDMIVLGAGTGGTMTGIGRKFREVSPHTKIVGIDPEGSPFAVPASLNETDVTFFEVEGFGFETVPSALDRSVCDFWVKTNDPESFRMARRLIREEGLLAGATSGAALAAALNLAKDLDEGQNVVLFFPDSIRNYLTKFVSDQWMEAKGFQPCLNRNDLWWWEHRVSALKLQKPLTVRCNDSIGRILVLLEETDSTGAAVLKSDGSLLGITTLQQITNKLISGEWDEADTIEKHTIKIFHKLDKDAILGRVSRVLEKDPFVLVVETTG
ncbi:cystathionine beta-synthase-like isoform X2 [Cylas formicarius]|nr:cystathionine beta-synthase-like isoform X2 [Cylas formicarius]